MKRHQARRVSPDVRTKTKLTATDYSYIVCDPFMIGYTFHATVATICSGCAPPNNLIKVLETVIITAIRAKQLVTFTCIQANRDILEPCGQVTLYFGVERPFQPFVGTVGMRCINMHH